MLFAGFIYAWGVLSAPIAADFPQWTSAQLSMAFTLCMAFFCVGVMASGAVAGRISCRVSYWTSGALFLAGFCLTARISSLAGFYVSYGVLCGMGAGFAYSTTINVIPRWFPKHQGLISGVLLMSFGFSSLVIGSAFTLLTPDASGAWRVSLPIMGGLLAAVVLASSFIIKVPQKGEVAAAEAESTVRGGVDLSPKQIVRLPTFWLFFLWAVLMSASGLAVIAQARGMALAAAPRLSANALSLVVGMISVCNGAGRVLFGALFDRIGRKASMTAISLCMLSGTALLAMAVSFSSLPLLTGAFVLVGLGYGGSPTMGASVIKQAYGKKYYPLNFSLINTNLLVASFASTAAGAMYDATGSFTTVFAVLLAGVLLGLTTVLIPQPIKELHVERSGMFHSSQHS